MVALKAMAVVAVVLIIVIATLYAISEENDGDTK